MLEKGEQLQHQVLLTSLLWVRHAGFNLSPLDGSLTACIVLRRQQDVGDVNVLPFNRCPTMATPLRVEQTRSFHCDSTWC